MISFNGSRLSTRTLVRSPRLSVIVPRSLMAWSGLSSSAEVALTSCPPRTPLLCVNRSRPPTVSAMLVEPLSLIAFNIVSADPMTSDNVFGENDRSGAMQLPGSSCGPSA